jgi:hypothetical protein
VPATSSTCGVALRALLSTFPQSEALGPLQLADALLGREYADNGRDVSGFEAMIGTVDGGGEVYEGPTLVRSAYRRGDVETLHAAVSLSMAACTVWFCVRPTVACDHHAVGLVSCWNKAVRLDPTIAGTTTDEADVPSMVLGEEWDIGGMTMRRAGLRTASSLFARGDRAAQKQSEQS